MIGANVARAVRQLGLDHEPNARRLRETLRARREVAAIAEDAVAGTPGPKPGSIGADA